jgi:hypothetical protein
VRLVLDDRGGWAKPRLRARHDVDQIGDWYVWDRDCHPRKSATGAPCLVYRSGFQEESGEPGNLHLLTWGLERDVADQIALGIPVRSG